jgi:Fe2+ or Zn2+ uptake regulation protein
MHLRGGLSYARRSEASGSWFLRIQGLISTRELFTQHRLRCTRQRLALYEALRDCTTHPTADELYRVVAQRKAGMSRATVYNTLESLCNAGLARRMPTANGCCRFDADTTDHLHVRMHDTAEIRDVPPDLGELLTRSIPPGIIEQVEKAMNIKIDAISIQLAAREALPNATITAGY